MPVNETCNEFWLFHGTTAEAARSIARDGFTKPSKAVHGMVFGSGTYFCECSAKADLYAVPASDSFGEEDRAGLCCMLLCRVVLGKSFVSRTLKPELSKIVAALETGQCHSVLGDREELLCSYREFVISNPAQAYPEFIVWYRRVRKKSLEKWWDDRFGQ